ncbi:serine hydrolase domain-containing protein [Acidithrix sp. C25]|uniref:serine hydrolase domain-containing protein n=1 Tax=Acidithrix sp. C25 TaxID=1671482 RepID=UPI00191BA269|nr:serine hydrolase domain-containing protein [Acidithrix sp. C25]CAG4926665.1 unnamed protein product [Acidithrix sp. C25]
MNQKSDDREFVDEGFGEVADVFRRHFDENLEVGAAVVAYIGDIKVVDISRGYRDLGRTKPFTSQTPVIVFSSTKGITAIAIHVAISQGLIGYDTPISQVWPNFGDSGKASITLYDTLTHRSGVAIVDDELLSIQDVTNWDKVIAAIERQRPIWEPGSRHGYHMRTFGWIHGELLRRLYSTSVASAISETVTSPLGVSVALEWNDSLEGEIADLVTDPVAADVDQLIEMERSAGLAEVSISAFHGPGRLFAYDQRWNSLAYRSLAMPSSSAMTSALSLAQIYKGVVFGHNGVRLLSDEIVREAIIPRSRGIDEVLGVETAFGMGFALAPMLGESLPASAFGHPGAGGSLGFGDLDARIGFGYAMNRMANALIDDSRSNALAAALYRVLG